MVFLSGRGGGQWCFPSQNRPAIGREGAGGGMAGLAQLGIVGLMGGVGGNVPGGMVFSAGRGWSHWGLLAENRLVIGLVA